MFKRLGDDTSRRLSALLLAAASVALATACDGYIQVRGRVYAQQQHSAHSRAFIDRAPDDDLSGLTPLAGAKVVLYHGGDYAKQKVDPSTLWKDEALTDGGGTFEAGSTTAPYKSHAALVVEKPGYKPVTQIFPHEGRTHTVVVILVPEE